VSYNEKHNEANGEDNKDGMDENLSWNCGAEGPTDNPEIIELRERQKRNLLATLLLSQGVPMLCGGDEISRSQQGNNNAYCQDNEMSWYDWQLDENRERFLAFVKNLIHLRLEHPVLRRRKFFQGRRIRGSDIKDIMWLRADGQEMSDEDWEASWVRCMGMLLAGEVPNEVDEKGDTVKDDTLLVLLNSHHEPVSFTLPAALADAKWEVIVDANTTEPASSQHLQDEKQPLMVAGRSVVLLQMRR
jgi:glycogen operon protein